MKRYGVSNYNAVYEKLFVKNLDRYKSLKKQIKSRIERILQNPYVNTEFLADASGKLNLIGCRSDRINRNFRIIFVICEECRNISECEFCFCENLSDGPHNKAYSMK